MKITTIIFDLGGVLIDWDPRKVYRTIFKTEVEIDDFFDRVCTMDWNERQDAGRALEEATEELVAEHPQWEKEIRAYYGRWEEMLVGPLHETVEILHRLKESGRFKLYALTNWSAETFPVALRKYDFLHWFDGKVVSGEEKMRKPAPEFYRLLLDRYNVRPEDTLFIDDNLRNVEAARAMGIQTIHFQSAKDLERQLAAFGIV